MRLPVVHPASRSIPATPTGPVETAFPEAIMPEPLTKIERRILNYLVDYL